ncbi:hypothetical protein CXR29_16775 [Brevibacterium linens]|nr:hypothetical protein CXR29_16775 [Brevibacterium linens]
MKKPEATSSKASTLPPPPRRNRNIGMTRMHNPTPRPRTPAMMRRIPGTTDGFFAGTPCGGIPTGWIICG